MNANQIISDEMTLEEKLAAIDTAMQNAVASAKTDNTSAPIDPATLTMCEACQ